ncbi:MAG TPA: hypothetical protein DCL86_01105, partial [Bacteroidales bacterium]|nr:hypothetical protein [Bacteroidales bacterium]
IPVKQIAERYGVSRATIYKVAPRNSALVLEDRKNEYKDTRK